MLSFFLDSVSKLWIHFCWIMGRGPILLQNHHIKLMDNKLKSIATVRYADDIKNAHNILHTFYLNQPNTFTDTSGKHQWFNYNKFIELPYHAFIIDQLLVTAPQQIHQSIYLSDLNWIQTKLKTTKCVQYILNDIYLISNSVPSMNLSKHLDILKKFLVIHTRPINYDADQFYPLFKHFIQLNVKIDSELLENFICRKWFSDFESIPISYLDIINTVENDENDDATTIDTSIGYDVISNLGGNGYFVASLNTTREEICVWDVPRYILNFESERK